MNVFRVFISVCLILASLAACAKNRQQRALNALEGMRAEQYFVNQVQAKFVTAIGIGDVDLAQELLVQGAEVSAIGSEGITPLIWALLKRSITAVEFLLHQGADPSQATKWTNERDREVWASPIEIAAMMEDPRYLKALLNAGADPNQVINDMQKTALSIALLNRRFDNAKLLISEGASVNHPGKFGSMPVLDAVLGGAFASALLLIHAGADPRLKSINGQTAIGILQKYGNRGVVNGSEDELAYPKLITLLKQRGYLSE